MVRRTSFSIAGFCLFAAACGEPGQNTPKTEPAATRAKALADGYLDGFLARNPDQVTLFGVPGRRHDKLPDNSMDAVRAWQARENAWLKEARQIDPAAIDPPTLRATYGIVREALEGATGARAHAAPSCGV